MIILNKNTIRKREETPKYKKVFKYTYEMVSKLTGLSVATLRRRQKAGEFHMADFESVIFFVWEYSAKRMLREMSYYRRIGPHALPYQE